MKNILKLFIGMACCGAIIAAPRAHAQAFYHVTVNTAPLVGNSGAPFALDFQFNDGSGLGDGNNTATIGNFLLGGGTATGSANLFGGASGSLASGVTLTDSGAFNEFYQTINAGSMLSFDVTLTTAVDAGGTPDIFAFAILDKNLANIPTTLPGDSLMTVTVDSSKPFVELGSSITPAGVTVAVPEPSSFGIAGAILTFGAVLVSRARKQK